MLSYTTILIASLVAVVVASIIYKAAALINKGISDSSKPAFNSNERFAVAGGITDHHTGGAGSKPEKGKKARSGQTSQATAWSLAQMYPVLPAVNEKQASAWPHHVQGSASVGKSSKVSRDASQKPLKLEHVCKPFRRKVDPGTPSPETSSKPVVRKVAPDFPGPGPANTAVTRKVAPTVTRKVAPRRPGTDTEGKPWGW